MHDKTYQFMMSSAATNNLKLELQSILQRDTDNMAQHVPSTDMLVAMAELALLRINGAFIAEKAADTTALTGTDAALQADIEYLRQRVNTLEESHRWAFCAGKGTSNGMAVFQETVNRGIEQALRNAVSPGGILYGKLK